MTNATLAQRSTAGLAYTDAGAGPAVLLVHGLISDRSTWDVEIPALSRTHRVIAPDLFGHGDSVDAGKSATADSPALPPPGRDYSLGGHAAALRDLLDELGVAQVVVVGHSLGGGIAMELAYLFPDRVRALALVSSGGLGSDLNPALRAASLPGSEWVLPLIGSEWVRSCGNTALGMMKKMGLPWVSASATAAWSGMATFGDAVKRGAFLATTRSVVGLKGQTVSALPQLPNLSGRPVLVVWGARDRLIPSSHAGALKTALPHSWIEIFDRAGHFPHLDEPDRFHRVLLEFLSGLPRGRRTARRPVQRVAPAGRLPAS